MSISSTTTDQLSKHEWSGPSTSEVHAHKITMRTLLQNPCKVLDARLQIVTCYHVAIIAYHSYVIAMHMFDEWVSFDISLGWCCPNPWHCDRARDVSGGHHQTLP